MKLEVGMYVRTKDKIVKIEKISDGVMWDTQGHVHFGDFIKASHNIIDLIEEGDYVNGQKVFDKLYDELNKCWYLKLEIGEVFGKYARTYQQHIKSIVTKEQFSSMEYKINE